MYFLDINQALKDGHFGLNPKTWGDDEWSLLISYVSAGIEFAEGDWDSLGWMPQIWSTLETTRTKAPPAAMGHIADLKRRATQRDDYLDFMCKMPSFKSGDALSTVTESTRQEEDDGDSVASYRTEDTVWNAALKRHLPNTIAKHDAVGKAKPKALGAQKKSRGKAKSKAASVPSGAASSK